ncbi:hypothetical protein [Nonomuraea sp. NPDC046570]|uniref:hypothetical protein n=1 Tax=Nonomuraea sp. NPDC046570 TaxID=3155255 RepID=UPI00340DD269
MTRPGGLHGRRTAALAVLALSLAACASGTETTPSRASTPTPASPFPTLAAAPGCAAAPRAADQLRPAAVREPGWRLLWHDQPISRLHNASLTPDGALWAMYSKWEGGKKEVRRWDGTAWTRILRMPPEPVMPDEDAPEGDQNLVVPSADAPWVLQEDPDGDPGWTLLRWDGSAWRDEQVAFADVSASWAIAQGPWVMIGEWSMRWSGAGWQSALLPVPNLHFLSGTDEEPWLVGLNPGLTALTRLPRLARWTGSAWQEVPLPRPALPPDAERVVTASFWSGTGRTELSAAVRTGEAEFWVLGRYKWGEHEAHGPQVVTWTRPVAMRNQAGRWTCFWGPATTREEKTIGFEEAVPDGAGGLWATTADDEIWHLSDGRWTRERLPTRGGGQAVVYDLVARDGLVYALGAIRLPRDPELSAYKQGAALWRLSP